MIKFGMKRNIVSHTFNLNLPQLSIHGIVM